MCSCDQSLVTVAFIWEKLSQCQFYKDLTRKTAFFEGRSWFKFNNLELALGKNLKLYTTVAIGLKLKVRKFLGLIPVYVEVTGEKLVWGAVFAPPPPPILNRVKIMLNKILWIFTDFYSKLEPPQVKHNLKSSITCSLLYKVPHQFANTLKT